MIRPFTAEDAPAVSALIGRTLRTSNRKDYPAEYLERIASQLSPEYLVKMSAYRHTYLYCEEGRILGVGAIGPYWDREDESSLFTIFVDPACQGRGIGRAIVRALEADEYALRARRIEIPASITALGFYQKLGYDFKEGSDRPDEEGLYRLQKFPSRG